MDTVRIAQAAALLTQVLAHELPSSCSLEEIELLAHRRAHEIARRAVEEHAQAVAALAEQQPVTCPCGGAPHAQQRRPRAVLVLSGLIRLRLRRYRCPGCHAWHAPGQAALGLRPRQRMTRSVEEWLGRLGLSWGFALAARMGATVLPGLAVSAKTVERAVGRCADAVATREEAQATAAQTEGGAAVLETPFAQPRRVYIGLDGVLVRGRVAKSWLEIQVGSLWSAWRERPGRQQPRREITDATVVARAQGWAALGRHVWRLFVQRGGTTQPDPEIVVLGDGAAGIRSLWELHFGAALTILDPWHLWEKVKQRSRQVLGKGTAGREACQAVYRALKAGAVTAAQAQVRQWPTPTAEARKWRDRLLSYLERNRDIIRNTPQLREQGYLVGSGLTEKANDLVVVPRMKNGKMHWSARGANRVALLRACLFNHPDAPLLPM